MCSPSAVQLNTNCSTVPAWIKFKLDPDDSTLQCVTCNAVQLIRDRKLTWHVWAWETCTHWVWKVELKFACLFLPNCSMLAYIKPCLHSLVFRERIYYNWDFHCQLHGVYYQMTSLTTNHTICQALLLHRPIHISALFILWHKCFCNGIHMCSWDCHRNHVGCVPAAACH